MAEVAGLMRLICAKAPFNHEVLNGLLPSGRHFRIEFDRDGYAVVDSEIAKYVVDRARGTIRAVPAEEGDEPTFTDPTKSQRRVLPNQRARGIVSVQTVPELRRLNQGLSAEERQRAVEAQAAVPEFEETPRTEPVAPVETRPTRRSGR